MAQHRRKRGRRRRSAARTVANASPAATPGRTDDVESGFVPGAPQLTRSQRRDAEARAKLEPLAPSERPWPIVLGAALCAASGLGNLIAYLAGAQIAGKHPGAGGIIVFSVLMIACAIGMWRLWHGAVLAFMALLAIVIVLFSLLLVEASNLLGLIIAPLVIGLAGTLFWKLVRVLGRIQMPTPRGR